MRDTCFAYHIFLDHLMEARCHIHAPVGLSLEKRPPDTHLKGSCVYHIADMALSRIEHRAIQPVANHFTDSCTGQEMKYEACRNSTHNCSFQIQRHVFCCDIPSN